jgi:hypothetical protein
MNIVYAQEEFPQSLTNSIFLAGPTPRDGQVSWRKKAIEILKELNYSGAVFVPEPRVGSFSSLDYTKQVLWEKKFLDAADRIVFWVPRDDKNPGLTTNIEFGNYVSSGKISFGAPEEAKSVRYLEHLIGVEGSGYTSFVDKYLNFKQNNRFLTLKETLVDAISNIVPSQRNGTECLVPSNIWNTKTFQSWYKSHLDNGNELKNIKIMWSFWPKNIFCWTAHVDIWIKKENRQKNNEIIFQRPDISSVCMYSGRGLDAKIVMIKEFRSPVRNKESMVLELPSGSSNFKEDPLRVASDELFEEVGIRIDKDRFVEHCSKQICSTLSTHHSFLFSVEATEEEMLAVSKANIAGNKEESELTYPVIYSFREIMENGIADWSTIGQISSIVMK